jgi:hypothetical protein
VRTDLPPAHNGPRTHLLARPPILRLRRRRVVPRILPRPALVVATKLLPRHLHVSAIGFAAAFGGSGAAIFPFAVGAIAQAKGVQVLQPIILALLGAILGLWLCLPRIHKKNE